MSVEDKLDISKLNEKEKRELLLSLRRLSGNKKTSQRKKVPTTDDELWQWVVDNTGFEIPRVAVCEDHTAPFDYVSDFFFERERSLLLIGSRELGKTLNTSIVNFANSELKPGTESVTFGAIESQAKKAYQHLKNFLFEKDDKGRKVLKDNVEDTLRSETKWKNGSVWSIIVGSRSGVNSPHPQKVHADEIDLMEKEVWDESRAMSSSETINGKLIKAQDVATSTWKSTKGLVQELMDEIKKSESSGFKSAWKLYISCIFDVSQEVSNCRGAKKEDREKRLKELGKDPCELCNCDKIVKGEWADGVPRTLQSVCRGKLFRSRGWMIRDDVVGNFMQNSPNMWVAQFECRRPMADGLYLPTWSREKYCITNYIPKPEYGLIYMGVDWGGIKPSFVTWIQGPLHQSLEVNNTIGTTTIIPKGSYVVFKEFSEAQMGATRLADKVVRQEIQYKNQFPGWRVKARFTDPAGRQQREDWREHNPPLRTVFYASREAEPMIECIQDLVTDHMLYVAVDQCPNLADDFESWRQEKGKELHDDSTHGPSSVKYCLINATILNRRYKRDVETAEPAVVAREESSPSPVAVSGVSSGDGSFSSESWRRSLLGPYQGEREPWEVG